MRGMRPDRADIRIRRKFPGKSLSTEGILMGRQSAGTSSSLTDRRLSELSGLDLKTIALARSRLGLAPIGPVYARPRQGCAAIPMALLTTTHLSAGARLLYGQLQGVPTYTQQDGSFTYAALSPSREPAMTL